MRRPRPGWLILGVGNALRGDDALGLHLVRQLRQQLGPALEAEELYELDIALAPRLAERQHLLVLDATAEEAHAPFRLLPLFESPAERLGRGFVSHVFDWGLLLTLARQLYGHAPTAELLAVVGTRFELGEGLSETGARNAAEALRFLVTHCTADDEPA